MTGPHRGDSGIPEPEPAPRTSVKRRLIALIVLLALLGSVAARLGGAPLGRGALRVTLWGAIAMVTTDLVGRLFGAVS